MSASLTISSASLDATGKIITVNVGGASGSLSPGSGITSFTVYATMGTVPRGQYAFSSATSSGTTVTLTLYAAIDSSQTVTLDTATGNLVDGSSNTLVVVSGAAVTNGSTVEPPPENSPGVYIPAGSLDNWYAARAAAASTLAEMVVWGDSTTAGSGPTPLYSWAERIREDVIANSYTDGGHGLIRNDTAEHDYSQFGDGTLVTIPDGGWSGSSGDGWDLGPTFYDSGSTAGKIIQFSGSGTLARIFYTRFNACGQFSYRVDGGSWTEVNANYADASVGAVYVTLSAGSHTLDVRNDGGAPLSAPAPFSGGVSGGGTVPAGSYYYVVTVVNGVGETTASTSIGPLTSNGSNVLSFFVNHPFNPGWTFRVYRSTSSSGPYYKLYDQASTAGTNTQVIDDGSHTPDGVTQPPTSSTAGLDTGSPQCRVNVEILPDAGIVIHNHAVSGVTTGFFLSSGASATGTRGNDKVQLALGLQVGTTALLHDYEMEREVSADARTPSLAIFTTGINDQGSGVAGSPDTSATIGGLDSFIRLCRQAGADPLVAIPHLRMGTFNVDENANTFIADIKAKCVAMACPYVDFNQVLDNNDPNRIASDLNYFGLFGGVHATKPTYQLEGDFLWDNAVGFRTGPLLSAPTATSVGTDRVSLGVDTDTDTGDLYYVVSTDSGTPTVAQIAFGTDANDDAAVAQGALSPPSVGTNSLGTATGLTPGTVYHVWYAQKDELDNESNVVGTTFTTRAAGTAKGRTGLSVSLRIGL